MPYGSVYKITNRISGRGYVGQTTQPVSVRWSQHFNRAFHVRHPVGSLQEIIRECGKEAFDVEVLETADTKQELDRLEIHFIELFKTREPHGYNKMSGRAHGTHSEKTKLAISNAHKGRKQPQHVKELNRQRMLGTTVPPEVREKISRKLKGRKLSPKTCAKMSRARRGKKRADAARMSSWLKGVPKSVEGRENIRRARIGKKASLLTRQRMSETHRKIWAERNANNSLPTAMVISQTA